jgi:hypothetical protein
LGVLAAHASGDQPHVRVARAGDPGNPRIKRQLLHTFDGVATDCCKDGDGRCGCQPLKPGYCHRNTPSRQAQTMPTDKMAKNMPISTKALTPYSTKTTAHGYMNTISISKAMKSSAIEW